MGMNKWRGSWNFFNKTTKRPMDIATLHYKKIPRFLVLSLILAIKRLWYMKTLWMKTAQLWVLESVLYRFEKKIWYEIRICIVSWIVLRWTSFFWKLNSFRYFLSMISFFTCSVTCYIGFIYICDKFVRNK